MHTHTHARPSPHVHQQQDSYLILEKLPAEYDSRVKAMEVDTKPTEEWGDIGGCDKQIQVRSFLVGSSIPSYL